MAELTIGVVKPHSVWFTPKMSLHPSIRSIIPLTLTLIASFIFTGCITTARTVERNKSNQTFHAISAEATEKVSKLEIPMEVHTDFQKYLDKELYYYKGGFQKGSQLKIKWEFTEFDQGNRALRYFVGCGAGKGKIVVHATFHDDHGHVLAEVDGYGNVIMGAFGGSYNSALRECAYEINRYAQDNFLDQAKH